MTRVDASPAAPVVKPERHFHLPVPKFSVGRLVKLAVLILILWALVQVARTGLWNIPLASNFFYVRPTPVHLAEAASTSGETLRERVAALRTGTVEISDGELTLLAGAGVQELRLGIASLNVAAIPGDALEFSFTIPNRHNALVRLDLKPILNSQGQLDFTTVRARVGEVTVPTWIIGGPVKLLLSTELTPILRNLPAFHIVRTIDHSLVLIY